MADDPMARLRMELARKLRVLQAWYEEQAERCRDASANVDQVELIPSLLGLAEMEFRLSQALVEQVQQLAYTRHFDGGFGSKEPV